MIGIHNMSRLKINAEKYSMEGLEDSTWSKDVYNHKNQQLSTKQEVLMNEEILEF